MGAADAAGDDVAAVPCTGERHVQQAQLIGQIFLGGLDAVFGQFIRAQIQLQMPGVVAGIGMEHEALLLRVAAVPGVRQKHNRILEALAAVDGHQLHGVLVALKAQLVGIVGPAILTLLGQPTGQRGWIEPLLGGGFMQ